MGWKYVTTPVWLDIGVFVQGVWSNGEVGKKHAVVGKTHSSLVILHYDSNVDVGLLDGLVQHSNIYLLIRALMAQVLFCHCLLLASEHISYNHLLLAILHLRYKSNFLPFFNIRYGLFSLPISFSFSLSFDVSARKKVYIFPYSLNFRVFIIHTSVCIGF